MAVNRKNRAYELRLALLHQDTPASGFSGSRLSSVGSGRFSRHSGSSRSILSPTRPSPDLRGRRRPHHLPQLGEGQQQPETHQHQQQQQQHGVVTVNTLRLGSGNTPLPPISGYGDIGELNSEVNRSRTTGPVVPPFEAIQQKQHQLRTELHSTRLVSRPVNEAVILQQLGDTSLQTYQYSHSAGDFVHAAALYNTALLLCDQDDDMKIRVRSRLIEAERQLLQNVSSCSSVVIEKYLAMDTGARDNKRLVQIRREVREALRAADGHLDEIKTEDDTVELRAQFADDMMNIAQMVQKAVLDVLMHIVTTCKAVLGEPPCRYAIMAVGPLVAGQGNPYHMPLEYVVLVGEDTKPRNMAYFHNFCHYMHLKVINLGETSLFRCGVRTLDDVRNERFVCFQDCSRKGGLHLDLSLHSASISPLMCLEQGQLTPETDSTIPAFLGAPWRVVGRLDEASTAGYSLLSRLLHYTLIDGDKQLVEDYKTELNQILARTENERVNQNAFSCDWLMSVLQEPEPVTAINNGLSSLNKQQLLHELQLMPQIISALKVNHNVTNVYAWDIVDSLCKRGVINTVDANRLKFAHALSYYLCLKASTKWNYTKANKNNELTDHLMQTCVTGSLLSTDSWAVQKYYEILIPCWTWLYQQARNYTMLSLSDCTLHNDNLKVQALAYDRLGDRANAISVLETEAHEVATLRDPSRFVLLYDLYNIQGLEYLHLGQHREARTCFNKSMELKEEITDTAIKSLSFVNSWHNFGLLHFLAGKYDKALEQLTEGINLSNQVLTAQEQLRPKDQFEAGVYENIAYVQTCLGMLSGALKSFEISLRFREIGEGNKTYTLSEITRDLHYRMGCLYFQLANYESALNCLNEALDIQCRLSNRTPHPTLWDAMIICQIGLVHELLGNLTLAAAYKLHTQKLTTTLCHILGINEDSHLMDLHLESIASLEALYELGRCLILSAQPRLALTVFECLQNRLESTNNHVKGRRAGLVDYGQVLLCKGDALCELERIEEAVECYRQVLDVCERSYSTKGQPVHLIATCHQRLGSCLLQLKLYDETTCRLDQAMELYRFTYGESMCHPDVCDVLKLQACSQREERKYEESISCLQHCLQLEKQTVGDSHIRIAQCLYETGLTYFAEGLYESAMNSYEIAMKMFHKLDVGCDNNCIEDLPKLYVGRAQCHAALGRTQQAERCWERAVSKARLILEREPSKHKAFIRLMTLYAEFYHQIEKYNQAIQVRNEVIQTYLDQAGLSEESHEVCSVIIAISRDYTASGMTDEAIRMYEKAISLRRKFAESNADKLELANWLTELGQIYARIGEQERSSECHLESLYLKKKVLGKGTVDEDVIASLETIAGVHEKRGELRQALALRKQSLAKNLQLHGDDVSPVLIHTVERVASALSKLNEHDTALQHWKDSLILRGQLEQGATVSGEAHVYHQCGHCYAGLSQYKQAIEHYQKSLKLLQTEEHEEIKDKETRMARTVGDIGKCLNNLGQSDAAIENLMTSSSNLRTIIQQKKQDIHDNNQIKEGSNNDQQPNDNNKIDGGTGLEEETDDNKFQEAKLSLASVLRHLGQAYETSGNAPSAESCYREAVGLLSDLTGSEDPNQGKADCLRGLGNLHSSRGDYTTAIDLLQKALTEYKRLSPDGTGSKDLAITLEDLAVAQGGLGNSGLTLRYLNEALRVLRQVYGQQRPHLHIARCLCRMASVCGQATRHEDTIAYARQALAMYAAILPENTDHPELVTLNELLGDCNWELGKYTESLRFYKKASQVCLYLHNGDVLHSDVVSVMNKLQNVQKQLGKP